MNSHIASIISFLNHNAEYAVLRNFEGLPYKNDSRDIDIIITKESLKKVLRPLVKMIDESGWKVVNYLKSDRLTTLVCGRVVNENQNENQNDNDNANANLNDNVELVQWDFFVNTSVWGLELMSAEEFLAHKQWNGFLWYVGVECQFLDKYLYNRTVGVQYPAKYKKTKDLAEHSDIVKKKLQEVFGQNTVAECDAVASRGLLMAVIKRNMRHPVESVLSVLVFVLVFVKNYLRSNTGFSIGFTGPDGSGKTTVIELMIKRLGDVFKSAHVYYHFRPMLYGNISDVAHSAGLKKEVDKNYSDPHRGGKTGAFSSLLRLFYYSLDYILGYFLKVKTVTRITRLVVFDRYFTDIICDSRRTRVYLPYKFLYWFGRVFIPTLDYNILLTAECKTILARKKELDEEGIRNINEKIDYLADKPGYYKVMNEGTPDEAVSMILNLVFEKQHQKNLKRIYALT